MRANVILMWILTVFFFVMATVYTIWNIISLGHVEWAGTVTIALSGVLSLFIGFYLSRVDHTSGGLLPEDRMDAEIDDGDPEIGHFSPWSWWPIILAGAAALMALGVAISPWIAICSFGLLLIALVGWTYEYYRGYFAK